MTAPVLLHPNSELVGTGWLKQVAGLDPTSVGTTLPGDNSTWAASGFVQLVVLSGNVNRYLPTKVPIFQVSCWSVNVNSARPPWGKANHLAECIRAATYGNAGWLTPDLPSGYAPAVVQSAYLNTEPRRINSEATSYARFDVELVLHWIEV